MLLMIEGTLSENAVSEFLVPQTRQLNEVATRATVYSKKQARAEFERFLSITDLSEGDQE